ncbi:MAG: hypothetical protein QOI80_3800 [Solirubrobacteraceae bacterium]|nr:hypothetical protein [Solirubrobacteraceae bacterium]
MRDLLHPPPHRGPLIAAGALVLTVGVALEQVRITPGAGVQLVVAALLALALLWLALQEPYEGGHPHAHISVLIVLGLLATEATLLRLADVLGADFETGVPSGAIVWTSLALAAKATFVSARRASAIAALIAAIAVGAALLFAWDWIFSPDSITPYRWLLLLLAFVYGLASLPLRGTSLRHAEQMVNAAGLAILVIPLLELVRGIFGEPELPGFWEFVVLVAGFSLVAYATADRAPGPAYLGLANLGAFVFLVGLTGDRTLEWWPVFLLVVGGLMLAAGLRPRVPLPPEPESSTRPDDLPLTVRVHRE